MAAVALAAARAIRAFAGREGAIQARIVGSQGGDSDFARKTRARGSTARWQAEGGHMRRPALLVGAVVLTLVVAGCSARPHTIPAAEIGGSLSPSPTPSPTPTPTPDAFITRQVCNEVTEATAAASAIIDERLEAVEHAAAEGDQAAMVEAAEAINTQFLSLSTRFAAQSQVPSLSPPVQETLADVSEALAEMASPRYIGTSVDIKREMIDFSAALTRVCTAP